MEETNLQQKKKYDGLDWLRTIACVGIVMMHMRANNTYAISGFAYDTVIASFTNFVFLFMVISAFGMCCGYYDRILNNKISLENFYKKRYIKILPFFAFLVIIDVLLEHTASALIEGFADITLLFGLFPNEISVIGVGWFLGLIFAFYLIFPFFCVLIKNKRRAWAAFAIAVVMNLVFGSYFGISRSNIIYSLCYFLAGGLIYLYREQLERFSIKHRGICLAFVALAIVLYYAIGSMTITELLIDASMMLFALGSKSGGGGLQNRFTRFFSSVSMEVYLSHMVIFRVIQKLGLNTIIGNGWSQYFITVIVVLNSAILLAVVFKRCWILLQNRLLKRT
jgi:peptidoglycan/LPS O-acetylase OafA/YrhL